MDLLAADRILCVDDDANVLAAYQRVLRKRFDLDLALGGEQALALLAERGPYAVVLTDLRMPHMDGLALLDEVRRRASDAVRIMLTAYADLRTAIRAVNDGSVFRFLTKPCPPDVLASALEAGVAQHRLIRGERHVLEQTLNGGIRVLSDVLALVNPSAFARCARVRSLVRPLAEQLGVGDNWQIETATLLSQVGCVTLPQDLLEKLERGETLTADEQRAFDDHPRLGHALIVGIPRLEGVARIVRYQEKRYDGSGPPADPVRGDGIPLGARILKVALDLALLQAAGAPAEEALRILAGRSGWYDPTVLDALRRVLGTGTTYTERLVALHELADHMVIAGDVLSTAGVLLVSRGQEVTPAMRARLDTIGRNGGIRGPLRVLVPAA